MKFRFFVQMIVVGFCLASIAASADEAGEHASLLPSGSWKLVFKEEFAGSNKGLDGHWGFQNGPSGHILSSRWRENVAIGDGIVKLQARKEERGGQSWTAASMWTKQKFMYGYYECRYRYAKATGTNNSFWLLSSGAVR
ncbi:MAG: glycoside hydrolase family 16 protein [Kiritimatiellae bacterium]|jgi:beta-glucanase (GH16 family)|nr:glycoside hydrolase family 16 protein [Kiritimatiellia bacterium]